MRSTFILGACLLALSACDSGGDMDAGPADSGAAIDSGPTTMDAGRRDSGPSDPCSGFATAIESVGCNGAVLGPARPPNGFGGACTASDTDAAGTCTGPDVLCWGDPGQPGICLRGCEPTSSDYVSRGGCPSGSRCFALEGAALCFPDCESDADCSSNNCDGEGSCIEPEAVPPTDGGVPDAGTPEDGGTVIDDGGIVIEDGGTVIEDAGTASDAGSAPDGGVTG